MANPSMFDFDATTALGFGRFPTALAARATPHMDLQVLRAQDAQEQPPSLRSVAMLTTSLRTATALGFPRIKSGVTTSLRTTWLPSRKSHDQRRR